MNINEYFFMLLQLYLKKLKNEMTYMPSPGFEPGTSAPKADMISVSPQGQTNITLSRYSIYHKNDNM